MLRDIGVPLTVERHGRVAWSRMGPLCPAKVAVLLVATVLPAAAGWALLRAVR